MKGRRQQALGCKWGAWCVSGFLSAGLLLLGTLSTGLWIWGVIRGPPRAPTLHAPAPYAFIFYPGLFACAVPRCSSALSHVPRPGKEDCSHCVLKKSSCPLTRWLSRVGAGAPVNGLSSNPAQALLLACAMVGGRVGRHVCRLPWSLGEDMQNLCSAPVTLQVSWNHQFPWSSFTCPSGNWGGPTLALWAAFPECPAKLLETPEPSRDVHLPQTSSSLLS